MDEGRRYIFSQHYFPFPGGVRVSGSSGEGACPLPRKKYNSNYNNILYNYNNILFLALATVTPAASA